MSPPIIKSIVNFYTKIKVIRLNNQKQINSRVGKSYCKSKVKNYGEWTVALLKEELRQRGAKTSGRKKDLAQRYFLNFY